MNKKEFDYHRNNVLRTMQSSLINYKDMHKRYQEGEINNDALNSFIDVLLITIFYTTDYSYCTPLPIATRMEWAVYFNEYPEISKLILEKDNMFL